MAHRDPRAPDAGDTVTDVLSLSLAATLHARGVRRANLSMSPAEQVRGRELTPAHMRECGARLEVVEAISLAALPAAG
ncbi:MAG: CRISPR-associated protein Csx16 [Thauera sp.]|nr:CRISPR-associated protein Csx16 [Thauera sp.]